MLTKREKISKVNAKQEKQKRDRRYVLLLWKDFKFFLRFFLKLEGNSNLGSMFHPRILTTTTEDRIKEVIVENRNTIKNK